MKIKANIANRLACNVPSFEKMAEVFRAAYEQMRSSYSGRSNGSSNAICISDFDESLRLFSVSVLSVSLRIQFLPFLDSSGVLVGQVAIQEVSPCGRRPQASILRFTEEGSVEAFIENDRYPDELSLREWLPDVVLSVVFDVLQGRARATFENE